MHTKTTRARGKVSAQYRWAYATSTLIPLQENGQNQHEKGGWAFNTSWAYNTYSTVILHMLLGSVSCEVCIMLIAGRRVMSCGPYLLALSRVDIPGVRQARWCLVATTLSTRSKSFCLAICDRV